MPRPYQKKSDYWQNRRQGSVSVSPAVAAPIIAAAHMEGEASFDDQPHYSARAACGGGNSGSTSYRDTAAPSAGWDNFPNIRSGVIPWSINAGGYAGASEAINLTYLAYFQYSLLRNAISLLCDFSVSNIHIKTPNKRVKTFFEAWFDAIGMNQFQSQFFLEYYRSGNVFIYKFNGEISEDGMNMLKQSFASAGEALAAKSKNVPIRYIILNPMQVYLQQGPTTPSGYVRMLSTYEIQRLRTPQTEEDKQVLRSLPETVQQSIKRGGSFPYVYVPLDQKRLYYVFYRKMDYEPLAIPMAYPVLNDIEYKLDLRRMDMALAATIERVILLVTTGRAADQYNQVPPKSNIANLQSIFANQTIGRVLVADYTTKAEWVVPDLKELLGPGKYEQVDKDIQLGLQYMFFGEEKFANASIKIKIFIESLKEGRRAFMETFLMPEVKKICQQMGFRDVPILEFEQIQIQDEAILNRLYVQMGQLGLLTDEEVNTAIKTGMLPTKEESLVHQASYKEERKKGFYTPLAPPAAGADGRPGGTGGTPATRKIATPIGQSKAGVEDVTVADSDILRSSKYRFGMTKVAENLVAMNAVRAAAETALAKKWKVKEMGAEEKSVAASIAQSIIFNEDEGAEGSKGWLKAIGAYMKPEGIKELPETVAAELLDIRTTFDTPDAPVDSWLAGILLRSKMDNNKKPEVIPPEPKAPTVSLADVDRAATVAAKTVLSEVQASNGNSQLTIEVKQDERPRETSRSRKIKVVKTAIGFDMTSEEPDQK